MAYGLEVYDDSGALILDASKKVGRFVGGFTVPSHSSTNSRVTTYQIPSSVIALGDPFLWFNADTMSWFYSNYPRNSRGKPYLTSTVSPTGLITVTVSLPIPTTQLYYGLM